MYKCPKNKHEAVIMCIGAHRPVAKCDEYSEETKRTRRLEDDFLAVDVCVALEGVGAAVHYVSMDQVVPMGMWVDSQDRLPAKDDMPRVLHDIGGHIIRQVIVQHPIVHALVITQRPLKDLLPTNRKLGATRRANLLRHIAVPEQLLPRRGVVLLTRVTRLGRLAERLHLRRTTGRQLAAQTDIPFLQDEFALQGAHRLDVAVVCGIGVPADGPAVAVAVQEDDHGGEVVVVVDDELEVGEGLTAFVLGGVDGGVDVVDGVDEIAPSGEKLR